MSVRSQFLTLTGPVASYRTAPDFDVAPYRGTAKAILYTDECEVFVSFDGENDHGRMVTTASGSGVRMLSFNYHNYSKVWFRTPTEASVEVGIIIESPKS